MSDSRQVKTTKSKSRKNPLVKSHPSTSSGNVIHTNYSISSTNISYQLSGLHLAMPMPTSSIIGKIDLEHLKQATFRNIKTSLGSPSARDDCINYALEMVISNLIINGRLDPAKAQNMRTPLMKAQIASICDKMIKNRDKKSSTSPKLSGSVKKPKTGARSNPQKWVLQPAALPITVVTDQAISPNAHGFIPGSNQSSKLITKKSSVGNFKTYGTGTVPAEEELKKKAKKKKCKSLESSTNNFVVLPPLPSQPHQQQKQTLQTQVIKSSAPPPSVQMPLQSVPALHPEISRSSYLVSSEVPSYEDWNSGKPDKTVQFDGSVLAKLDDMKDKNSPITATSQCEDENSNVNPSNGDRVSIPFSPVPLTAESRCHSAGAESCPSSTKTLNALISSSSSIANSTASGFQILVDMKGFNNDEISMEVEGRQLIFLASRPKRNDVNLRKVTEIVDVPPGVNLENIKIGRRVDGFVVVEEYEIDTETS